MAKNAKTKNGTAKHIIALDLDGTVLNHGAGGQVHRSINIDPDLAAAILTLHQVGHEVVVATGRSTDATLPVVEALKIKPTWVVATNGAVTLRRDPLATRAYRRAYVEAFDATEMLTKLRPQIATARFAVETAAGEFLYTEKMPTGTLPVAQRLVTFDELLGVQASRIVIFSPDMALEKFIKAAQTVGLANVSYAVNDMVWLDIAPKGVTKASALDMIAKREGISANHFFAAGDGQNDINMLQWAARHGRAVAMGQASDEVKSYANSVTDSIVQNGLYTALREHFAADLN